jgi:two-component system response regulator AtoC
LGRAYDYLEKPLEIAAIVAVLDRLEKERYEAVAGVVVDEGSRESGAVIVGRVSPMISAYRTAAAASRTNATVLIRGESGTGKKLLARAIHDASGRDGAFAALNCAAIVDTLVESELFGYEKGAFTGADRASCGFFRDGRRRYAFPGRTW